MSAEPGWYYYEGDPIDTVRRWDGMQWIGFATTPPPIDEPSFVMTESLPMKSAPSATRAQLAGQTRLQPFAIAATVGLICSIISVAYIAIGIGRDLVTTQHLSWSDELVVPSLSEPYAHPAFLRMLVVLVIGGACFLVWLWYARNNVRNEIFNTKRLKGFWAYVVFGPFVWLLHLTIGPIIRAMFGVVERSGSGRDEGSISPFGPILWWVLWLGSSYAYGLLSLYMIAGRIDPTRTLAAVAAGLLVAHIVSLMIALMLVTQVTILQDRELLA